MRGPREAERPIVVTRMVRQWAKENGRQVGARGRIPEALAAEYRAAKRRHPSARGRQA